MTLRDATDQIRVRYLRAVARIDAALARELGNQLGAATGTDQPRLGPFRLVRRLGGGIIEVWLAVDERSDRPVVLKASRGAAEPAESIRGSIAREGAAGAELDIPGIPRVLESGEIGDVAFLVREFEPGAPLSDWIAHRRTERTLGIDPSPAEVREVIACVARAARVVAAMHSAGWVHGDLKPGNLLVGIDGRPWLLDLGCAARIGAPLSASGSPAYAAPERLTQTTPTATVGIDVWALGASLFECTALQLPFQADDRDALLLAVLSSPLSRTLETLPWLPASVGAVIRWALDRRAERRCPTASAFAADLERALGGEPTHAARALRTEQFLGASRWIALAVLVVATFGAMGFVTRGTGADLELQRLLATHGWVEVAERDADTIWPAWPQNAERLRAWLARHAEPLRQRRAEIAARMFDPQATVALRPELDALDRFLAEDTGTVAAVERRLWTATSIADATIGAHAEAWRAAAARVAADPRFAGFTLPPLVGLVPLGPDPVSGLEEFHDVGTAAPGTAVPTRDPQGHLALDARHGLVFVLLPGGVLLMGEQRRDPAGAGYDPLAGDFAAPETVTLAPFLLSKFELTNGQWTRLTGSGSPSYMRPGTTYGRDPPIGDRHPVEQVSWEDARRALARDGLDLPTEAQWERAARAGSGATWTFGDNLAAMPRHGNVRDTAYVAASGPAADALPVNDGFAFTAPVGSFEPDTFGLFDLHGNVAEWCRDTWDAYGPANPPRAGDGLRTPVGGHRSIRGGSYAHSVHDARSRCRMDDLPTLRSPLIGVRPVRPWPEGDR